MNSHRNVGEAIRVMRLVSLSWSSFTAESELARLSNGVLLALDQFAVGLMRKAIRVVCLLQERGRAYDRSRDRG